MALTFPASSRLKQADWLELRAVTARDESSSGGDLERALQRVGTFGTDRKRLEDEVLAILRELELRAVAAQSGYPFEVNGSAVRFRGKDDASLAYLFCLCLSFFRWTQRRGGRFFPRRMFERLSATTAALFLSAAPEMAESIQFGSPREDEPAFRAAVGELCRRLGEGVDFFEQAILSSKDDGLDVVAWRDFRDGRPGKLLLLGHCASGADWSDPAKLNELQPPNFFANWMVRTPVSPVVRAYFIPHRVEQAEWEYVSRAAGILFDRCRLALWATGVGASGLDLSSYRSWTNTMLARNA